MKLTIKDKLCKYHRNETIEHGIKKESEIELVNPKDCIVCKSAFGIKELKVEQCKCPICGSIHYKKKK